MRIWPIALSALLLAGCGQPSVPAATGPQSAARHVLEASVVEPAGPSFDVRAFGATGDGTTNDTTAFQAAAAAINAAGGGTLVIPPGTYVVGRQTFAGATRRGFAYRGEDILHIHDCQRPVVISGQQAVLRAAPHLKLGAFDPVSGNPTNAAGARLTNPDDQAIPYFGMVRLTNNADVRVSGLELDGNLDALDVGGGWGDTGRQCPADGIYAFGNGHLAIAQVRTHHQGEDGLEIGHYKLKEGMAPCPVELVDVDSEYNARQGLSWVGGIGLSATRCKFSHTGRARFASAPAAGVDVEAENSICRDGLFVNCEFLDNVGVGLVADTGDSRRITCRGCSFWGTTCWSLWPHMPEMRFEDCSISGTPVNAYASAVREDATQFTRCHFEDRAYPGYPVRRACLVNFSKADNVSFTGCDFIANEDLSLWLQAYRSQEDGSYARLKDCHIVHRWRGRADKMHQCVLNGVAVDNVTFDEEYATRPQYGYYISFACLRVDGPLQVNGFTTRLGNWSWGRMGLVPTGFIPHMGDVWSYTRL